VLPTRTVNTAVLRGIYTTINFVRLSVIVGDRGKRRDARGWLGVLGVVDTRFGVSQPAADAERYRCACLHMHMCP